MRYSFIFPVAILAGSQIALALPIASYDDVAVDESSTSIGSKPQGETEPYQGQGKPDDRISDPTPESSITVQTHKSKVAGKNGEEGHQKVNYPSGKAQKHSNILPSGESSSPQGDAVSRRNIEERQNDAFAPGNQARGESHQDEPSASGHQVRARNDGAGNSLPPAAEQESGEGISEVHQGGDDSPVVEGTQGVEDATQLPDNQYEGDNGHSGVMPQPDGEDRYGDEQGKGQGRNGQGRNGQGGKRKGRKGQGRNRQGGKKKGRKGQGRNGQGGKRKGRKGQTP